MSDTALRWAPLPQQYVAKVCSTGFTMRSCTVSAVDEGQAVVTQEQLGQDAWQDVVPAVDVLAAVQNASERPADEGCDRDVSLHEIYGFPSEVYSDCGEEGWGIAISCFAADTLDLSLCQ